MKNAWMLILLILLIGLTGCSSRPRFSFDQRTISIETVPSGAIVRQVNSVDDGEIFLGTTPIREQPIRVLSGVKGKLSSMSVDWMTSQILMLNVRIDKVGFESYRGNLATDPMKTVEHKITLVPTYR